MVLSKPLSITSLGKLLSLDTDEVIQPLFGLQSLLTIPGDDNQPVQLLHTSLRDFLTMESRSRTYFINPPVHHFAIAMDCLRLVVAHVENGHPYGEVQMYACEGWYLHLRKWLDSGNHSRLGSNSVNDLTYCLADVAESQHYDCWINMLIFTDGQLDDAHHDIRMALSKV
jgi:hypothetical protein